MVMSLGIQDINVDYYENDILVESEKITREVRQYKNGRLVAKYGPGLEVFQSNVGFSARVDRVDFSDLFI
jgi:hypothetical protein